MKKDETYRFCLQFGMSSEEEIRAGDFLERLGRRKSPIVITAINEFLDNHPEMETGEPRHVKISTVTLDQLEERLRQLVEERLSGIDLSSESREDHASQAQEVSQDIVDMLSDLELFNM